ncbi:hypothetical protein U472_15160 [Orenia metallireducens]|jgi:murein DD-endopeptidase MepM/ murein hydrolase activator NlpD|uniref:LysM domain-containing protein n=1 Tax=Orenia metallireducens TaxID=1413210 RepID=A0A1C0A6A8_9FIRM|nr:M23 family metallopeptidase [Orenia metallireducens]OCL25667.1 hypothetical protein U472_15160 [Orenia metallireducens]
MKKILIVISLLLLITPLPDVEARMDLDLDSNRVKNHLIYFRYEVKTGDTLWKISKKFNINLSLLLSFNPSLSDKDIIVVGQKLNIPDDNVIIHKIKPGETIWSIAQGYNISSYELTKANNIEHPNLIQIGDSLIIPISQSKSYSTSGSINQERSFIWPTRYKRITSPFGSRWGRMHKGIDIAAPKGSVVRAAKSGVVTQSRYLSGYGKAIYIDHGNGVSTRYAHNSRLLVRVGERVYQGQVIAYSGSTGRSTGPHLHFEIRIRDRAINPLTYLD